MKKLFYIDYPQEHVEGKDHTYRCAHCKVITTTINGRLEGHLPSCTYRQQQENKGFELLFEDTCGNLINLVQPAA